MNDKDRKLIEEAKKRFKESSDAWAENRRLFSEDVDFVVGNQWPSQIQRARDMEGRPCLTINRMMQFVRQVVNDQRQNKPSIDIKPVDDEADVETADMMQGLIRHIEANSCADLAYDTGCFYSVAGSFGFWRIVTDYAPKSFDQEIYIRAIENPLTVYPDADSKAIDGSDWEYCFITDEMPKDRFQEEYGDKLPTGWDSSDGLEGLCSITRETVRIAEYFYIEKVKETLYMLRDGSSVYASEYGDKDDNVIDEREDYRKAVKWCLLGGNQILERRDWAGSIIPVVVVYGDAVMVNGERKLLSLIRFGKDAQRMLNYYRSTEAEMLALQPKTPFIAAEGQLEGYEDVWASANNVNYGYLPYKPTTIGGMAVPPPQRVQSASLPSGMEQMSMIAERDLMNTIGIHEAGLGMKSNESSGRAIMARQREGDTATYHFIDNVTRAIRQTGKILVDLIPKIYDRPGRVIRILGLDGSEEMIEMNKPVKDSEGNEIRRLYDPSLGQYDVICTAGPSYTTRRQEAVQAMMAILPQAPQLMQAAGDLIIKSMDWPGADEIAERLVNMMPPEFRPKKESDDDDEGKVPPEMQAALKEREQIIQQMDQTMQAMQQELDSKQATEQAAMMKVQLEAQKLEIDQYKAETDRMKAEAEIMMKLKAPELSEIDKLEFEAATSVRLQEMKEEHEAEMAVLEAKLRAAEPKEPEAAGGATIERDAEGRTVSVNGRAVVRDENGDIIGLQ